MNKKLLAVAVTSALAVPMAAQAVKYKLSGQVNRAIVFADDGIGSDVHHVDADASGTRFRMVGSEDIGNGMKVGFHYEIEHQSNDSLVQGGKLDGGDGDDGPSIRWRERQAKVYFSGNFGKVTLGQGSTATDGIAFADQTGAWVVTENSPDFGGSIPFKFGNAPAGSTVAAQSTGITPANVTPSYDGGRKDMLRYDTPALGPFTFSTSVAQDQYWDVAAYGSGSMGGGSWKLNGGFISGENRTGYDALTLSGSFKFSQGTSINLAWGNAYRTGGEDGEYIYAKLGHDWGNNSVSIDYYNSDDAVTGSAVCAPSGTTTACGAENWGVSFQHRIPKPSVDIYAGYKIYQLEDTAPGVNVEDVQVFVVGSRVKFD